MAYPIIQWFIQENNLGAVKYKGQSYNLNRLKDRVILSDLLIVDKLITISGKYTYDELNNTAIFTPDYYAVDVQEYAFIKCKEDRFFWINLVDRLLPQLSEEECQEYNDSHEAVII